MVSEEVLARNSLVLARQPRSSRMVLRHTDVSTIEAYYILVGRAETALPMEKLGPLWARNGQSKKFNAPLN